MPRICYVPKNFGQAALNIIDVANEICEDYERQGYDLTLRQLYYQFVARDLIENTIQSYKRLGDIINDARLAGLLDWDYIVDRTRNLMGLRHFNSPAEAVKDAASRYHEDLWATQPRRIEVWVEKEALAGVVQRVSVRNDVSFFSCRGYTSQSEVWGAAQRIGDFLRGGQDVTILHLGDHDPSGLDMTRDIRERMAMFISKDNDESTKNILREFMHTKGVASWGQLSNSDQTMGKRMARFETSKWGKLFVDRIALNMDQVRAYNPPPNPAKITDSRAKAYIAQYGRSSWELDALDPRTLDALIQATITGLRDEQAWQQAKSQEGTQRLTLATAGNHWTDVATFLEEIT